MAKQIRQFMEQDEIARRNIAIAAYMGWQVTNDVVHGGKIACDRDSIHGYTYWTSSPPFNVDWNLLMPTVEKIMEEIRLAFHAFPKGSGNKSVCRFGMLLKNETGNTMIEATWFAVSEYVLALK